MQSWIVSHTAPIDEHPLTRVERDEPEPGPGQLRVRVSCCGVCRTDLHLAEGDLPPKRPGVTPGHEVVGTVDAVGDGADRFAIGDRVGVPWLGGTDQSCRFCRRGDENLCLAPTFTGWDVDGGYADACLVDEAYAYALPAGLDDEHAAPLLCAGIIGYRALVCAEVPPGGRLGIYGFGGSAHLTAQVALHQGLRVHVMTRGEHNQQLARDLGADSVGGAADAPPEPLDGAILFAPAGTRAGRAARARPGRHAGRRRHLAVGHPVAELRGRAVRGAAAAQRHRQHPPRRGGLPRPGCTVRHPGQNGRLPDGRRPSSPGRPRPRAIRRGCRTAQLNAAARCRTGSHGE